MPADSSAMNSESDGNTIKKKRLAANSSIGMKPRAMTKSALQREAQQAEQARQEFIVMREAVKATEVSIPFVFYDGTNTPGGRCRIMKGDHIWLFLDKARKVGAELGVGGGDKSRREWARVSVDDLMLVRGEVILPHVSVSVSVVTLC
jgi:protein FAM50